jgi:hypothetical protein
MPTDVAQRGNLLATAPCARPHRYRALGARHGCAGHPRAIGSSHAGDQRLGRATSTMTRECGHPARTLVRRIQTRRSVGRSLGRGAVRLYTAQGEVLQGSWRWPPQRKGKRRGRWSRKVIIAPGLSGSGSELRDQLLGAGRSSGEGQPVLQMGPIPFSPIGFVSEAGVHRIQTPDCVRMWTHPWT